jgi:hypothetical protein
MLSNPLVVTIPDKNNFYSLYADGLFIRKSYIKDLEVTRIFYDQNQVVFLFYTYPTHREACAVRNTPAGSRWFPGLSKPVSLLFSVHASRVDKLRRAVGFLNTHEGGAYSWDDGFYIRLLFILSRRGGINYFSLRRLAEDSAAATTGARPPA